MSRRLYPEGRYPGYIILLNGEVLDSGNGDDDTTVYGEHADQQCVDRAVACVGLDGAREVTIKKVWVVEAEKAEDIHGSVALSFDKEKT